MSAVPEASYTADQYKLAWDLTVELRKEIVESQKIRAQILGVKVTFVSAGIGLIFANLDAAPIELLVVPAFAALFFDFLTNSYNFSIQRIGRYCKENTEKVLRNYSKLPREIKLWEEYLAQSGNRTPLHVYGNMGITAIAILLGSASLVKDLQWELLAILPLSVIPTLIVLAYLDAEEFMKTNIRN
jgi:hypothetical protein